MYGFKRKGDVITIANLKQAKTQDEVKKLTVNDVKKAYNELALDYNHLLNLDYIYCPQCGNWKSVKAFYGSNETVDGIEHFACKECILSLCTDKGKDGNRIDNREKTIATFKKLNWYFNEKDYKAQLESLSEGTGEKIRSTAVQQLIVMIRSLPNWKGLTYADSDFGTEEDGIEISINRKPRKEIYKIFGNGFTTEDYLYLQEQYDDWKLRTQVDSKSQETYIIQICFKQLEIWKAQKAGKDTDKLVKSLNDLMNGANLQPRQNVSNAATDSLTFGQLIERWELERPVPEPAPEFQDVDNIGKYLRVFFSGWLAKAVGLKNALSQECEDYISQYAVTKPEYQEEGNSNDIYGVLFGNDGE